MVEETNNNMDLALAMCPAWGVVQPPIGISCLKSFLKEHGINVKCFDFSLDLYEVFPEKKYWDLNHPDYFITPQLFERYICPSISNFINKWAGQILNENPKAVGLSLFMSSINVSFLLAKHLKEMEPDLIIIGGGPEVTRLKRVLVDGIRELASLNRRVITDNIFDILVDGEGEETLLEILSLLKLKQGFHKVEGIIYARNDKLVVNRPRRLMDDLDRLSPPDYRDFELERYTRQSLPIVTSRGCINRCTFCADSPLWKIYRHRSPEKVVSEIKLLIREYKIKNFEIMDSTFNGDVQRVERICDLIIESKLDIHWSAKVALRREMRFELLAKMKRAGCNSLAYGVESGSPRVLADMHKNNELAEIKTIIRDTQRAGIEANCFFIIGYPTEAEEDFQLTLNFLRENAEFIHRFDQITGCHIEEDSYLGLNPDKYGIIFKEDGWYTRYSTPQVRKERLERFRELARELHQHYQCEVQL